MITSVSPVLYNPHDISLFSSEKGAVFSINKKTYDLSTLNLIKDRLPHTNGFTLIQEWSQPPLGNRLNLKLILHSSNYTYVTNHLVDNKML